MTRRPASQMDEAKPPAIRVLLVDDHQLLTDALAGLLRREADIDVLGIASTVGEAQHAAAERPDVVLMDYRLPDGTGAEATRAIKSRWPRTKVIMLSAITDDETVLDAIRAGVDGYLTKDQASHDVVSAVRSAHAGDILLPRELVFEISRRVAVARREAAARSRVDQLTPRELEVLGALAEGLSSRDICERLYIAPNTLRTHVQNIMTKLRVHSKLEAVAFAIRQEMVSVPRREMFS